MTSESRQPAKGTKRRWEHSYLWVAAEAGFLGIAALVGGIVAAFAAWDSYAIILLPAGVVPLVGLHVYAVSAYRVLTGSTPMAVVLRRVQILAVIVVAALTSLLAFLLWIAVNHARPESILQMVFLTTMVAGWIFRRYLMFRRARLEALLLDGAGRRE